MTSTPSAKSPPAPRNWLHYLGYFLTAGSLVWLSQQDTPQRFENAMLTGAIASGAVLSRDWYKARLTPELAHDSTAAITLFNEMLHAGRSQVNTNAAHLKRVEFLQKDLAEAMRDFNDTLRLNPEQVEQQLRQLQAAPLAPPRPQASRTTHVPDSTTVHQSLRARPGFDA